MKHWQSLFGRVSKNIRVMFVRPEVLAVLPFYLLLFLGIGLFADTIASERTLRSLFIGGMIAPMFVYALFYVQPRLLVFALPGMLVLVARGLSLVSFHAKAVRLAFQLIVCSVLLLHSLAKLPALAKASQQAEYKAAGRWISEQTDRNAILMTRVPQVVFYADRDLAYLPYVEDEPGLYAAAKAAKARYVVFDEAMSFKYRPKLGFCWTASGCRSLHVSKSFTARQGQVRDSSCYARNRREEQAGQRNGSVCAE